MTYSEKLKSPKWQKKRLEILNRDNFQCKFCGDIDNPLHVHHISYCEKDPWDINNDLLLTLCESCHKHETDDIKNRSALLIKTLKDHGFVSVDFEFLSMIVEDKGISVLKNFMNSHIKF